MKISARVRWSRKSRVKPGGGDEATFSSRVLVVTCSCWLRSSPREPRSTNRNLLFIADLRVPWPYRVNKNERERANGLHLCGYCQWNVRRKKRLVDEYEAVVLGVGVQCASTQGTEYHQGYHQGRKLRDLRGSTRTFDLILQFVISNVPIMIGVRVVLQISV